MLLLSSLKCAFALDSDTSEMTRFLLRFERSATLQAGYSENDSFLHLHIDHVQHLQLSYFRHSIRLFFSFKSLSPSLKLASLDFTSF